MEKRTKIYWTVVILVLVFFGGVILIAKDWQRVFKKENTKVNSEHPIDLSKVHQKTPKEVGADIEKKQENIQKQAFIASLPKNERDFVRKNNIWELINEIEKNLKSRDAQYFVEKAVFKNQDGKLVAGKTNVGKLMAGEANSFEPLDLTKKEYAADWSRILNYPKVNIVGFSLYYFYGYLNPTIFIRYKGHINGHKNENCNLVSLTLVPDYKTWKVQDFTEGLPDVANECVSILGRDCKDNCDYIKNVLPHLCVDYVSYSSSL